MTSVTETTTTRWCDICGRLMPSDERVSGTSNIILYKVKGMFGVMRDKEYTDVCRSCTSELVKRINELRKSKEEDE